MRMYNNERESRGWGKTTKIRKKRIRNMQKAKIEEKLKSGEIGERVENGEISYEEGLKEVDTLAAQYSRLDKSKPQVNSSATAHQYMPEYQGIKETVRKVMQEEFNSSIKDMIREVVGEAVREAIIESGKAAQVKTKPIRTDIMNGIKEIFKFFYSSVRKGGEINENIDAAYSVLNQRVKSGRITEEEEKFIIDNVLSLMEAVKDVDLSIKDLSTFADGYLSQYNSDFDEVEL